MDKRRSGKSSALGDKGKTPDPLLAFIGTKIRDGRESSGVSQDRFSFAAEIERAYYGSVERGKRNLTVATLVKIAVAQGVDPAKLLPTLEQAKKLLPKPSGK